ncbi:MAG: hypothetical protein J4F34_04990 [Gemmatimonadetes bacterium]|nr:hypothetical protein [Gemmatimonadota bacterium]
MRRSALAMLAAGCCVLAHGAAAQETDQEAMVRDLLSNDPDRVISALGRMPMAAYYEFQRGFEPTAELVEALVATYDREFMLGSPNYGAGSLARGW